ncbi:MAG: GntR family transcriptional regulator [Lachnospiraceae bacterium]|nr:GntR family transcriptional regulator [Lachnospiraceae bacterium]
MDRYDSKLLALNYMKEQIITCAMPPGSSIQIPEIAETLGISKTPVREALLELQHEGYVTVIPRKRTIVAKISLQDLKDIYDARSLVEIHILSHLSSGELESNRETLLHLKEQWQDIEIEDQSRETYMAFLKADLQFHRTIIQFFRNPHLVHFCEELICKSQRFWYMALFNNRMDVVREEHLQILDALLSGDTAAAAAYCEKHISISKALSILSE